MKLLSTLTAAAFPLRASIQALFTVLILVSVVGLEVAGRSATTDAQDSVYGLILISLIGLVVVWHRRRPLGWVDWLAARSARLLRWVKGWRYEHGIDFRGTPPLPHRVPRVLWGVVAGLIVWAGAGAFIWTVLPGGWRAVGVQTSYVLYLLVMVMVWAALITGLLGGLFVPVASLDRRLIDSVSDSDRRLVTLFAGVCYLIAITAAAALVPVAAPLILCAVAAAVAAGWAAGENQSQIAILWRTARGGPVFAVPIHRVIAGGVSLLLLTLIAVVVNGRTGRLLTPVDQSDVMPFTASLAALVAWTVPGLLFLILLRVRQKRRTDPANRTPPTVFLTNKLSAEAGERAKRLITGWGWGVRTRPMKRSGEDVAIELVHPELSEATEFDPRWPLKVAPTDLANPLLQDRLVRRDEIHLRRRVFRGLKTLLKKAIASRTEKSGGYWLAPHWWFFNGLGREDGKTRRTDDGESELLRRIGPPFSEVFGERPRQHLHKALRAVQIDLIYIEDGVSLKALTAVLRTLFEVYDMHAGKKVVDDHSFRGIPKVRVMVHEFSPLKPPTAISTYRQPKFDDLSRGRVLHIFRDKGDHEELSDAPRDIDYVPSPVLVG